MSISSSLIANVQSQRRVVTSFVFFIAALLMAYKASGYIVENDFSSLAFAGVILAGSAIVVLVIKSWRQGLYFFLAWLMFEDLARKFLSNNMAIYFAKDVIVTVIYLAFFIAYRKRRKEQIKPFRFPFRVALFVFVWFGIIQIFNPASA